MEGDSEREDEHEHADEHTDEGYTEQRPDMMAPIPEHQRYYQARARARTRGSGSRGRGRAGDKLGVAQHIEDKGRVRLDAANARLGKGTTLLELPGCGHCPQEEMPDVLSDAIASFVLGLE